MAYWFYVWHNLSRTKMQGRLLDNAPPSVLRDLVRGLTFLFWGLPLCVVIFAAVATTAGFGHLGVIGPAIPPMLICYGFIQVGSAVGGDLVWRRQVDRALLLGLIMVGLAPFLYWWHRVPENLFFSSMVIVLCVTGFAMLFVMSYLIQQLAFALGEPILLLDARRLGSYVRISAITSIAVLLSHVVGGIFKLLPQEYLDAVLDTSHPVFLAGVVIFVLTPLATVMSLLWKMKQLILNSVFGRVQDAPNDKAVEEW